MRVSTVLVAGTLAISLAIALIQWQRASVAKGESAAGRGALALAQLDANELVQLRQAAESRLFGEPPSEDFVSAVGLTLATVGINQSAATSITREADRAAADPAVRVRDMRIELKPITIAQLGSFLAQWNAEQPAWTVRTITIRKSNDRRAAADAFHASLTCSAEYTAVSTP